VASFNSHGTRFFRVPLWQWFGLATLVAVALVAAMALRPTPRAEAAGWYVDPAGNDANACTAPGAANACLTLQAAITKAANGDTIHVAGGTYTVAGLVTVNKTLTLLGAQAGVGACGRAGSESVLSDSQGMRIAASNVVIDGFTVQDSVVAAFTGYGIWMDPSASVSGTQVVNNIIQNNIVGIGLANAGPSQALIQHNAFQTNNQPGGASGSGIYTDEFVGGQVTNVLIDANCFKNNANAGVGFSSTDTTRPDSNIEIKNNSFDQNGRGIYFQNTNTSTVHNNSITNSTVPTDGGTSVAIAAFGDVNGLTILNNDLLTGALRGIRVGSFNVNPNTNVEAHQNNIVGFATAGLYVDAGGHTGPVNATCNWWGSATGPTNVGNPGGTGDTVTGSATFSPWLLAAAPSGSCLGGVTPTSTPVTPTSTPVTPTSTPVTPTATPPASVGGVSFDPGAGALPGSSGSNAGMLAGIVAATAAAAIALGSAAWYTRTRRVR
jgi:parallel beta-helix repeat protein